MSDQERFRKYVDYIAATGRVPLLSSMFDEDWEPIGPLVRRDMTEAGLISERDGALVLTERAKSGLLREERK